MISVVLIIKLHLISQKSLKIGTNTKEPICEYVGTSSLKFKYELFTKTKRKLTILYIPGWSNFVLSLTYIYLHSKQYYRKMLFSGFFPHPQTVKVKKTFKKSEAENKQKKKQKRKLLTQYTRATIILIVRWKFESHLLIVNPCTGIFF